MAQTWKLPITSGSSATGWTKVNAGMESLRTLHSGASEPAEMVAAMLWHNSSTGDVSQRNSANTGWIFWFNVGANGIGSTFDKVGGDRGDASVTLTVAGDGVIQRFATTLTANRTVTLSTSGASNGSKFRVVRTGLGAFTLDVGGLKTIPSATAAYVDVSFNGTAWVLTGYGLL